jgi:hypothetical protein
MLAGLLHGVGGFSDACIISLAGSSPRKGTPNEIPDFVSHGTDKWALHLLPGGRPERRADDPPAARASLFLVITDVHARYFGTELNDQSLTPGDNARIGSIRFEHWLKRLQ